MQISFPNRRLAKKFNSDKELTREYGRKVAKTIQMRLAVLRAARCLRLVPVQKPVRRHQLVGDRKGKFAVDLVHPFRLVFVPDHNPVPRLDDGGIDLEAVIAIQVLEVVDYH